MARPMPWAPPVTTARRPARSNWCILSYPRGFAPRTPLRRRSRALSRSHPLRRLARGAPSRGSGLCPSDSPTPSLPRAFALPSAPAARSRRSLARIGALPLGLPYAVAPARFRAPIRSGGSLAALPRADRGFAPRTPLRRRSLALSRSHPLRRLARGAPSRGSGLCPSDSPTPSLTRAFALPSAPAARSRRSLARIGALPLGLPYAVAHSRFRAPIRSGGSLAALPRADRGFAPRTPLRRRSLALSRSHPLRRLARG